MLKTLEKEHRFTITVLVIMTVIGSLAIYGQATHLVTGPPPWRAHNAYACSHCWGEADEHRNVHSNVADPLPNNINDPRYP